MDCKKPPSVALSTIEAKYKAKVGATCEAIWLYKILCDLKLQQMQPTNLHWNNQCAIKMTKNPIYHSKTKHVEIHHHYIREWV